MMKVTNYVDKFIEMMKKNKIIAFFIIIFIILIFCGDFLESANAIYKLLPGQGSEDNRRFIPFRIDTPTRPPYDGPSLPIRPTPSISPKKVADLFFLSGWIGDIEDISFDGASTDNPYSGPSCIKITYSATGLQGWGGLYWQYPDENWGDKPDGRNLEGATKLTFWARGKMGEEKAEFGVGGMTGKYPDSIQPSISTGVIILSNEWKKYTIDLNGKDLSHVISGFFWVTSKDKNPNGSTIFLDDITYE